MQHQKRLALIAILVIGISFFSIYILSYPRFSESDPVFISPDENVSYFFSNLYRETGQLRYPVPYYDELPHEITIGFTPRDAAQTEDGTIVPKRFLGSLVTFGVISVYGKDLLLLLMPFFGVMTGVALYLVAREVFGEKTALLSYALVLTFPVFWILSGSRLHGDTLPSLFFLFLGIYYVVKLSRQGVAKNRRYILLAALFFASSMFFRLDQAISVLPVLVLMLWLWKRKRIKIAPMFATICLAAVVLLPILLLNQELYGGYFTTGYSVAEENIQSTINLAPAPLWDSNRLIIYLTQYALHFPLLLFGAVLGTCIILAGKSRASGNVKYYVVGYACYLFVALLLFFGRGVSWGLTDFAINASFLRHFLPAFLFMIVLLSIFLSNVGRRVAILLLAVVVVSSGLAVISSNQGIHDQHERAEEFGALRDFVLEITEENAVIITQYRSTALFPQRTTISTEYWVENPGHIEQGDKRPVQFIPTEAVFAEKILALLREDLPVYLVGKEPYLIQIDPDRLREELDRDGYVMDELSRGGQTLYRLCKP